MKMQLAFDNYARRLWSKINLGGNFLFFTLGAGRNLLFCLKIVWREIRCLKAKTLCLHMQVKVLNIQETGSSVPHLTVRHPFLTALGWGEKFETSCSLASQNSHCWVAAFVWLQDTIGKAHKSASLCEAITCVFEALGCNSEIKIKLFIRFLTQWMQRGRFGLTTRND